MARIAFSSPAIVHWLGPVRNPREGILLTVLEDRLLFYHQQRLIQISDLAYHN